ncbi:MAG TPA: hypothetical protein VFU16_07610 [Solirubrobacterales bacterium]|nr:hypothetical protein [Solirubrobacterales bacterium]
MGTLELSYALPQSRVRINSTVTTTKDSVLSTETTVPQTTAVLEMGAESRTNKLRVRTGPIFNTGVSLELNDEGLLKSSSLESSGELGKVVLGVVGAAATVAGALVSPAGFGGALSAQRALFGVSRFAEVEELEAPKPRELEDAAFAKEHRRAAELRNQLRTLIEQIWAETAELTAGLPGIDNPEERSQARERLLLLQRLQAALKEQLAEVNELFKVWRATTIATRTEEFERLITLDEIHAAETKIAADGSLCFGSDASTAIEFAWSKLRIAVTVSPPPPKTGDLPAAGKNRILVCIPRKATIDVYEKGADGKAVLKQSRPALVMDAGCEVEVVKLRRSIWAKRNVSLKFSELGALNAYTYQADSSAAAFASTAGDLPGKVTGGLESALKARQTLGSLETRAIDQQLAKVKAEAELKQEELKQEGLTATARDYAALEALKQRAAMFEQRKAIRDARYTEPAVDEVANKIAQMKQQVELLTLEANLKKLS